MTYQQTIIGELRYPLEDLVWMLAWIEKQERTLEANGQLKKKENIQSAAFDF